MCVYVYAVMCIFMHDESVQGFYFIRIELVTHYICVYNHVCIQACTCLWFSLHWHIWTRVYNHAYIHAHESVYNVPLTGIHMVTCYICVYNHAYIHAHRVCVQRALHWDTYGDMLHMCI